MEECAQGNVSIRNRLVLAGIFFCGFLFYAIYTVYIFWNIPFFDTMFDFLFLPRNAFAGELTLSDFRFRYTQHGMFGYSLLYLLNVYVFNLSMRFDIILNTLLVTFCAVTVGMLYCKTILSRNVAFYIGFLLIMFAMFTPTQESAHGMSIQIRIGVSLAFFQDLRYALAITAISILIIILIYDIPRIKKNVHPLFQVSKKDWMCSIRLLKQCSPMVIVLLSSPLLQAIPRIYFERLYSAELFGVFSAVAAPSVIIIVLVSSALIPFIPRFAQYYGSNKRKDLTKLFLYTTGITLAFGVVSLIAVFFVGEWVLAILYGEEIRLWTDILFSIIIATIFMAIISCFVTLFMAARKLVSLSVALLIGCGVCYLVTPFLVDRFQMDGISFAMIAGQGFSILILISLILVMLRKMRSNDKVGE